VYIFKIIFCDFLYIYIPYTKIYYLLKILFCIKTTIEIIKNNNLRKVCKHNFVSVFLSCWIRFPCILCMFYYTLSGFYYTVQSVGTLRYPADERLLTLPSNTIEI
jgi:hypothetical protein